MIGGESHDHIVLSIMYNMILQKATTQLVGPEATVAALKDHAAGLSATGNIPSMTRT